MPRNTIFLLIHAPGLCLEAEATCYTFAQAAWKLRRSQRFGSTVIAVLSADNHWAWWWLESTGTMEFYIILWLSISCMG
jgi:hypothetical protein